MITQTCNSCGFQLPEGIAQCPNCQRAVSANKAIRLRGMVLMGLGAFLSGGMAYLSWIVGNIMQNAESDSGTRFTGTPRDAMLIYAIFGAVFVFGATGFVAGLWQVITGRRNRGLIAVVLAIGLIILVLAVATQILI